MLVWSYYPFPTGGAENQCRKLSRSLTKFSNIHCVVLTARIKRTTCFREKDGGVDIVRIPVPQTFVDKMLAWRERFRRHKEPSESAVTNQAFLREGRVVAANRLAGLVRWANTFVFMLGASFWLLRHRREIDILHVHIGDWLAGYGGWIGSRLRIPVLCKAANMPALPELHASIPFRGFLHRWRRGIHYVALHEAIRADLVSSGAMQGRIQVIPNGVEIPAGKADPRMGKYVLYVGNFSQGADHKGFDVLCMAWAQVCLQNPKAKLMLAGQGDNAPWREMLIRLDCAQYVDFLGYVPFLDDFYQGAALFVLPSRHEGMSNALLEAQAWGLPAVVSAIPGNRAVVNDGVTGVVVPVGDHMALAEAILCLLADPQKRGDMGMRARDRINEHFTIARVAGSYTALYAKLLQQKMV